MAEKLTPEEQELMKQHFLDFLDEAKKSIEANEYISGQTEMSLENKSITIRWYDHDYLCKLAREYQDIYRKSVSVSDIIDKLLEKHIGDIELPEIASPIPQWFLDAFEEDE